MSEPLVTGRWRSAFAWGVVGTLAFLVLHQAYLLVDAAFLGVGPVAAIALVVFAVATAVAYLVEVRLASPSGDDLDDGEGC